MKRKGRHKMTTASITRAIWSLFRAVIVIGICFVILYPVFIKLSVAFMDEKDLYDSSVVYIPKNFTWQNFRVAWEGMDYTKTFVSTFTLSFLTSVIQLFACLLTAYGFARFKFPGKNLLFGCVILTLIVPPQIIMLPLFMHFRFFDFAGILEAVTGKPLNLIDTDAPFFLQAALTIGFKNGLYIYLLRQFFRGMPKELEEAAHVDGCNRFRTFLQIMLPSAVPMMVTVFLFGFVWQWTDSFFSGLYLPTKKVMASALSSLAASVSSSYSSSGGSLTFVSPGFTSMMNNTGVILIIVPLLVLYLISQKSFVEGIERSGIVG